MTTNGMREKAKLAVKSELEHAKVEVESKKNNEPVRNPMVLKS